MRQEHLASANQKKKKSTSGWNTHRLASEEGSKIFARLRKPPQKENAKGMVQRKARAGTQPIY